MICVDFTENTLFSSFGVADAKLLDIDTQSSIYT